MKFSLDHSIKAATAGCISEAKLFTIISETVVSSTNLCVSIPSLKSSVRMMNTEGPSHEPWGMPPRREPSQKIPGRTGLADTRMSPFWILLELKMMEVVVTKLQSNYYYQQTNIQFLTCRMPFLSSSNSVKALKGIGLIATHLYRWVKRTH